MDKKLLDQILEQYPLLGTNVEIQRIDSGYINDTFQLVDLNNERKYILQRINTEVFSEVNLIMRNIDLITNHIQSKLDENSDVFKYHNFKYLYSKTGLNYIEINDHSKWRICDFIDNYPPDLSNKSQIAKETGKILAYFHVLTEDFNIDNLVETITDFHNIKTRWDKFDKITKRNNEKLRQTSDIYNEFSELKYLTDEFDQIINTGNIPLKVVHNDPKLDNVLFDENGKSICMIDLDTVMPGYITVDFGDAIRSLCNTAVEDEKNMGEVSFDMDIFKSFTRSYLSITEKILSDREISNLAIFPILITFEQALRFYTDFLSGDIYYKIQYPEQNLIRTKVQLKLLRSMVSNYEEMKSFISQLSI